MSAPAQLLVVDDEPDLVDVLVEALERRGFAATGHISATEALAALREDSFDVLLTDLMMPDLDGIALLRAALELDPYLAGIIMTGQATVQTAVDAMKVGAVDYLLKPFKLNTLLPVLERALTVRRLRMENVQLREAVAMYDLTQAIEATLDPETVIDKVVEAAYRQCDADEASIMLLTPDGYELQVAAVRGSGREHLIGQRASIAEGIAGWVARHGEPVMLEAAVDDPRFAPVVPRSEIRSAASLPMLLGGSVTGVLNVNLTRRRAFTPGEVRALSILASTAASALASTSLFRELRETNARLTDTLAELELTQQHIIQQERLRALGAMASGIAHDFNNALAPILGYSELLLELPEALDDPHRVREYLGYIRAGAEDAAGVVRRLSEFYRQRDADETFAAVDLNQIVTTTVALTQPRWKDQALASGRTIGVETRLRPLPHVAGDETQLREMLANLVLNAVDALPQGGTIEIRTQPRAGQVLLEVSHNGIGMTEEVRRRCLEPFFSTKGKSGTGLGLAMVYGVVQRHNGTIDIDSEPGLGTTFSIYLPVEAAAETQPLQAQPTAPPVPLRVLVVDDEPAVRAVLTAYLHNDGHSVDTASDGREGLERLRAGSFDVVITDRAMPGMSGDQLAAEIKSYAPHTPVILLTGFGDIMGASDEKPAGVDVIASKPITWDRLRAALTTARR